MRIKKRIVVPLLLATALVVGCGSWIASRKASVRPLIHGNYVVKQVRAPDGYITTSKDSSTGDGYSVKEVQPPEGYHIEGGGQA